MLCSMEIRMPGVVVTALLLTGCGGGTASTEAAEAPELTVSAASSLTEPFTSYGESFEPATVRLSFGASGEQAAQIRQGTKPDVYAAANTTLPDDLAKEGLVDEPVVFATNELVIAVPADSDLKSIDDLGGADLDVVIGSETVPIGAYTQGVLRRLPDGGKALLANVRSEEPDVKSIVGKLTQGAADAGFVYISDVVATKGDLRAIELDPKPRPDVAYGAAVVTGSDQPDLAQEFIEGLLDGPGAQALSEAGFGPPPGG